MKDFKIASCQMNVVDNKVENVLHAMQLVGKAADNGAQLVTLPEMSSLTTSNDWMSLTGPM